MLPYSLEDSIHLTLKERGLQHYKNTKKGELGTIIVTACHISL
jgi:hypothetical protein